MKGINICIYTLTLIDKAVITQSLFNVKSVLDQSSDSHLNLKSSECK